MIIDVSRDARELGKKAAELGATEIRKAIEARGEAHIILATGVSQFQTMGFLVAEPGIAWDRVTAFHLDEYLDLPETHLASFRRYLKSRFVSHLKDLGEFVFIEGDASDTAAELARVSDRIGACAIDVAFIGIGENGHLAFNDPPADFDTVDPFIVVQLDERCRRQQLNEGWFSDISEVPQQAISMSIGQILKSNLIVCAAPDARKAEAIKNTVEGPVSNLCPASILQQHANTHLLLDLESAALLDRNRLAENLAAAS